MANFTLQLLHTADQEAGIPAIEDAVNFSAVLNALEDNFENTLKLSSGDLFIAGPFLNTSREVYGEPGIADILINNALGFQGAAIGNHEFDLGPGTFEDLIRPNPEITGPGIGEGGYPGTAFPYLSTNLNFGGEPGLAELVVDPADAPQPNSITDSVVIDVNGEPIGVVGATTPQLPAIANIGDITVQPSDPDDIVALAGEIQPAVDELVNEGIDKIILLSHMQQISIEEQLAELLTDVDIVMAGGSNTILADDDDILREGDEAAGPYPIFKQSPADEPVYVINTDGNYQYVGQFVADFNESGIITEILDATGIYATDEAGVDRVYGEDVDPAEVADPTIVEVTDAIGEVVTEKEGNVFGTTEVFLNGTRADVRTQETNLGNLTATANLDIAREYDSDVVISIKNGGGIRDSIGNAFVPPGGVGDELVKQPPQAVPGLKEEGEISQLDIENSLRFNNDLSLLTVTAEELKQLLEYGVAATAPGATPGQFPQVAGISFSFDPERQAIEFERNENQTATGVATEGERVRSVAILNEEGEVAEVVVEDGEVVGDPSREFRLVTLGFLAGGGDGYPFPLFGENQVNLIEQPAPETNLETFAEDGTEQDALAEYLAETFPADDNPETPEFTQEDTPVEEDTRIQNLTAREDTVLEGVDGGEFTLISEIQGSGEESPLEGEIVTIEGVVVGDFQNSLGTTGFFVQEEDADVDNNPDTSEGIFVFDPNLLQDVEVGDRVQVTGEVEEFFGKTELTNISELTVVESGVLDEVSPATVDLPVSEIGNLEAFEGMLVTFPETLSVTDTFNLGRFGELTLSAPDELFIPTNSIDPNDVPPSGTSFTGDSNVEAVLAKDNLNDRSKIILDDGSQADADDLEDPLGGEFGTTPVPYVNRTEGEPTTIRRGSTVDNLTGVLDFNFGNYRIQRNPYEPEDGLNEEFPLNFDYAERPEVPEVGGDIKVATFNVLNYFTTIDTGENLTGPNNNLSPRGADSEAEFERQRAKIVSGLLEIDADIVGLVEIENNGDEAISNLVDTLNAEAGALTYDFISDPPNFNDVPGSTDAIKVGIIYKPDAVTPVGEAKTTDSEAFDFPPGGRAPVAQTFEAGGEEFTVMVNHFKSKGGSGEGEDADQNDGQGAFNATRKDQARAVADFVEQLQAETGDNDVLVLGDLNAYTQEDPIDLLRSEGLVDELNRAVENPYTFVFFGEAGALDYALATPGLSDQITGAAAWHINVDEPRALDYNDDILDNPDDRFEDINPDPTLYEPDPFRSSDHDPVIVGLDLFANIIEGTPEADRLVGLETDDKIFGRGGNDTVAGGLGDDELFGEAGNDVLRGDLNSRRPQVNLAGGNDTVAGGAGNDRIGGKSGDDELFGDEGNDQIWGDDGDDLIRGGLGNDILVGDDFSGGEGSDTFVLATGEGTDTIVDFEVGVDIIGLAEGLTFEMLSISTQGNQSVIAVNDETLATLNGVTALTEDAFSLV